VLRFRFILAKDRFIILIPKKSEEEMAWQKTPTKADKLLGKKIEELRKKKVVSLPQLGKKVNEPYQQIERYEKGVRLAVDKLEAIAEALGEPIPKRIIRRIVFARKLEAETNIEQEELLALYESLFDEDMEE
jgi:transcriptional regulator with XRE-family HTH domain